MGDVIGLRGAIQPPCDVEDPEAETFVVTVNGDPGNGNCLLIVAMALALWVAVAFGLFWIFSAVFDLI